MMRKHKPRGPAIFKAGEAAMSIEEISRELGTSRQNVTQCISIALRKVKQRLVERGFTEADLRDFLRAADQRESNADRAERG